MSPPAASGVSTFGRKTTTIAISGVSIGIIVISILLRRWFRRGSQQLSQSSHLLHADYQLSTPEPESRLDRPESVHRGPSRMRATPSISDRGSARQSSFRHRGQLSTSVHPVEADIMCGSESIQEVLRMLERTQSGLDLIRNRSDKDRQRADMLSSIVDRMRVLETDISRLLSDGGFDEIKEEDAASMSSWANYQSPRGAGTLSVLSDDSFMSAFEDFPVIIDDEGREILEIEPQNLLFYNQGLEEACNGGVQYRKARTEFCQCESETDFAAKVWCLRKAFDEVLKDDHRRVWLANSGRTLLADLLKHQKQDPTNFYKAFDDTMSFFNDESNVENMQEELAARGVVHMGFWDVVLDFIFLDCFDDLKSPPSAIYSVTKNFFLSNSAKYSTINTVIWSMLKAKRTRLSNPKGFIANFYNISEAVSPALTLGFLGTDQRIGELCNYFKEQITSLILDIFNTHRVRYTSIEDLAEDIWIIVQSRTESVQSRLSTELIPI